MCECQSSTRVGLTKSEADSTRDKESKNKNKSKTASQSATIILYKIDIRYIPHRFGANLHLQPPEEFVIQPRPSASGQELLLTVPRHAPSYMHNDRCGSRIL